MRKYSKPTEGKEKKKRRNDSSLLAGAALSKAPSSIFLLSQSQKHSRNLYMRRTKNMRVSRLFHSTVIAGTLLLLAPVFSAAFGSDVIKLTGAGASFPAPLYQRWFRDYFRKHPNVRADYQAIGSGAGVENFVAGRLDFAGSDLPLTDDDAAKVDGGIVQIPLAAGAVVMSYNLPNLNGLRLSKEAVGGLFLGEIQNWNDPLVQKANPGVDLPDLPITLVARSDSSGTSFVITRYLSAVSEQFAKNVGVTMTPVWPEILKERGALIRGKGNGGVAAYVKAVPGSIGYVQYAYASLTNLQMASLQNQAGEFVAPGSESFKAAVESFKADLDPLNISDPRSPGAYPIISLSWLIARKSQQSEKAQALKDVLRYALADGQTTASLLGYIPLSEEAVRQIVKRLDSVD